MNLNHYEAIQMVQRLYWALKSDDYRAMDVSVHPPFTDIRSVQTVLEADNVPVFLGAQNCHWKDTGPYTGEVSPAMLAKLNVHYVIVGHSERRHQFGETNEMVAEKVAAVCRNNMTPILCVGETKEQHARGEVLDTVMPQLRDGLAKVKQEQVAAMVIAYEPVWAVGTDEHPHPEDVQAVCCSIRGLIADKWGAQAAQTVRLQYGGSVKATNARDLLSPPDVDGALIGRAGLDAEELARIVAAAHS